MQGNLIQQKNNTVDRAWQFIDRIFERWWVAILVFTALYLAGHGIYAAIR